MLSEVRLLYAILERAFLDLTGNSKTVQSEMRQALNWISEEINTESPEPFSFAWVCLHLDLCPHTVRKSLLIAHKGEKFPKKYRNRGHYDYLSLVYEFNYGEEMAFSYKGNRRRAA